MSRFKNPRAASMLLLGSGLCFLLVAALGWNGRPLIVGMNALTAVLMFAAAAANARRARRDAA